MSLFEWADSSEDDWTLQQKVDAQLDLLGVSVAAHPLELVADKLAETGAVSTLEAAAIVGRRVTVAGVQQASHRSLMAKGVMMLFLSVEDLQGTLDTILFPEIYRQAKSLISSSMPFFAHGNYGDGYRTRGTFLESGKSCLVAMNVKLNSCLLCKCSCSKAAIEYGDMKRETCGGYHISPMKEEKRNSLTSPNELICTGIDTYYS